MPFPVSVDLALWQRDEADLNHKGGILYWELAAGFVFPYFVGTSSRKGAVWIRKMVQRRIVIVLSPSNNVSYPILPPQKKI